MKPLVVVPSDLLDVGGHQAYKCGDKYLRALVECADVMPLIIPSLEQGVCLKSVLKRVDGVMLTGGHSNVHPDLWNPFHPKPPAEAPIDKRRDTITLALVCEAIELGKPLIGLCRGLQEINVALGGSLHTKAFEVEGYMDHRQPPGDEIDVQYGPNHSVNLVEGGILSQWVQEREFTINSLHRQAIDKLADDLTVEATAADGLIEAASAQSTPQLVLGMQWHPEFKASENAQSKLIFAGFRRAIDGEVFSACS